MIQNNFMSQKQLGNQILEKVYNLLDHLERFYSFIFQPLMSEESDKTPMGLTTGAKSKNYY